MYNILKCRLERKQNFLTDRTLKPSFTVMLSGINPPYASYRFVEGRPLFFLPPV